MRFGEYEVEGHLGAGGMSQVWLARGPAGYVVLKRQLNPSDDQRLRDEAQIGLRLQHANVVHTLDLFEHEGRPVLVLEYVGGASLVALRKRGPLAASAVCSIGADVADGLAALHNAVDEHGRPLRILHRDVTPSNIIVTGDGRARLIDLGIARFAGQSAERTKTGDLRGTIRYLAPELFDGKPHSARSDLWSLGVCLFEAALGRAAVSGPEAMILASVVRGTLLEMRADETIEPSLASLIARLCTRDSSLAFPDAASAAHALRACEAALGDGGRHSASVAVYATVERAPPPASGSIGPAADLGDDAFVQFAATTYCGADDEDLFASETPITASQVRLVPAPVTAISDPTASSTSPFDRAPRSSPGAQPASIDHWNIPQPITGESAGEDGPSMIVDQSITAPEPRAPGAVPTTAPNDPTAPTSLLPETAIVQPATTSAVNAPVVVGTALDDPSLDELQGSAVGAMLPVAAAVVAVVVIVVLVLIFR